MKYFIRIICLFILYSNAYAMNKIVNAPNYTNNLRQLYIDENKNYKNTTVINYSSYPGSKLWRNIRLGETHTTQIQGNNAGILINSYGEDWRNYRNQLSFIGGSVIVLTALIIIFLIFFIKQFKIKNGFSGELITRFNLNERLIHWGTAALFILLALTGLILLLGRYLLIPLFDKNISATIISAGKEIHDLFGPIFIIFLVLMIIKFIKDNFYQQGDIDWLLKAGGLFGKHVDAERFNFGEKIWFWIIFFIGLLISFSGIILLFPDIISEQRIYVEISHIIHTIAAIFMIVSLFGHIYMSIALEGSMSAMTKGVVDKNWAKEHHSLWYKNSKESIKKIN